MHTEATPSDHWVSRNARTTSSSHGRVSNGPRRRDAGERKSSRTSLLLPPKRFSNTKPSASYFFVFTLLPKRWGPYVNAGSHTGLGETSSESDPSPRSRSHWRHTRHKCLVTDSAFGARGDLVYSGEAVEIAGLRSLLRVSSAEEHFLDMEGVSGSIPLPPTRYFPEKSE